MPPLPARSLKGVRVLALTGASDRAELGLLIGVAQTGAEVLLVGALSPALLHEASKANITCSTLKLRSRVDLRGVRTIRKFIRSFKPTVIHAFTNRTLSAVLIATSKIFGVPTSAPIFAYRGTCGHVSRWDPAAWMSYLHPRLTYIMCVSNAVREYLVSCGISPDKLRTIYKGHDPSWYQSVGAADRAALGIDPSSLVVGFFGNMRPVKGADVLLAAAGLLADQANVHFLFVGEVRDPSLRVSHAQHPSHKQIHFIGFRKDVPALIMACDLVVVPSRDREGLPRALLEAMFCGRPVVASKVGGIPEIILDGESGVLVPPGDAAALAAAIREMVTNPERLRAFGQAALERAKYSFSLESTRGGLIELYSESATAPP